MTKRSTVARTNDLLEFTDQVEDVDQARQDATHLLGEDEHLVRHSERTFAVVPGRNGRIASRVMNGETYNSVAADFGISSERVRQLVRPHTTSAALELRSRTIAARRQQERVDQVLEYARAHPHMSIPQIARDTGHRLTSDQVAEALGPEECDLRPARRVTASSSPRFSDEECLEALRKAATDENGELTLPVSTGKYVAAKTGGPNPQTLMVRFGSWRQACEAAGVQCANTTRDGGWIRSWSDDDLRRILVDFFREEGTGATNADYRRWAERTEGAPSLATVRNRLGRWSVIRFEAVASLLDEAS